MFFNPLTYLLSTYHFCTLHLTARLLLPSFLYVLWLLFLFFPVHKVANISKIKPFVLYLVHAKIVKVITMFFFFQTWSALPSFFSVLWLPYLFFPDHKVTNISKIKPFVLYLVRITIAKVITMFFFFQTWGALVLAVTVHPKNDSIYLSLEKLRLVS